MVVKNSCLKQGGLKDFVGISTKFMTVDSFIDLKEISQNTEFLRALIIYSNNYSSLKMFVAICYLFEL